MELNFNGHFQEEHMEIQAKREDGTNLTWSEVNNMPYTAKVSSISSYLLLSLIIDETLRKLIIYACLCTP